MQPWLKLMSSCRSLHFPWTLEKFEWWIHIFWQHNCNIIIHFQKKSQFIFWKGLHFCKRLHTFCNELSWYAHKRQICVKGLAASKRTIWRTLWLISMLLLTGKFFLCAMYNFFVEKKFWMRLQNIFFPKF